MIHNHLDTCESTSVILKNTFEANPDAHESLLVSTSHQVAGVGRMGNSWIGLENALALSFMIKVNPVLPTLTSLEVGVALVEFLNKQFNTKLKLKWPNDILNEKLHKIGGILLQSLKGDVYSCGIGINLSDPKGELLALKRKDGQYPAGTLLGDRSPLLSSDEKKELSFNIATYILRRIEELRTTDFSSNWNQYCAHLGKEVEIRDAQKKVAGIFQGIGPQGEALLDTGEIKKIYSGSLFIL